MSCDSYYGIGDKHQVCQDYALHGSIPGMEYAIVADGCSGAPFSEIGAQILCHAAKYQIALSYSTGLFKECSAGTLSSILGNSIFKRICEISTSYPISRKALEATLFIAVKTEDAKFVFGWGDGVVIYQYKDESGLHKIVCDIDYPANAPFYLACNPEEYLKNLQSRGYDDPKVLYTQYHIEDDGSFSSEIKNYPVDKPYSWKSMAPYMSEEGGLTEEVDIVSISVCTDGIKSFQDEKKSPIQLMEMLPEVVGYKTTDGEFVKKRMFFLKRKAKKNNWLHSDDLGCGTIFF